MSRFFNKTNGFIKNQAKDKTLIPLLTAILSGILAILFLILLCIQPQNEYFTVLKASKKTISTNLFIEDDFIYIKIINQSELSKSSTIKPNSPIIYIDADISNKNFDSVLYITNEKNPMFFLYAEYENLSFSNTFTYENGNIVIGGDESNAAANLTELIFNKFCNDYKDDYFDGKEITLRTYIKSYYQYLANKKTYTTLMIITLSICLAFVALTILLKIKKKTTIKIIERADNQEDIPFLIESAQKCIDSILGIRTKKILGNYFANIEFTADKYKLTLISNDLNLKENYLFSNYGYTSIDDKTTQGIILCSIFNKISSFFQEKGEKTSEKIFFYGKQCALMLNENNNIYAEITIKFTNVYQPKLHIIYKAL